MTDTEGVISKYDTNLQVIPNVGRGDGYGQMSRAGLAL